MVVMPLSSFEDVRRARQYVHDLALAVGIQDPSAATLTTAELGNNCVEHGSQAPGVLRIGGKRGRLSLRFENPCPQRPDWRTRKPVALGEFRTGGYGLQIVRALARSVNVRWANGRVVVRAEFA
jgi:anti-sigma regulatory factor (Ser/Thr protein kinase)